jgi:hypothetical protein
MKDQMPAGQTPLSTLRPSGNCNKGCSASVLPLPGARRPAVGRTCLKLDPSSSPSDRSSARPRVRTQPGGLLLLSLGAGGPIAGGGVADGLQRWYLGVNRGVDDAVLVWMLVNRMSSEAARERSCRGRSIRGSASVPSR